jgi:hypothetical protein
MRGVLLFCIALLVAASPGVGTCGPLLNEVMADPNRDWDGDGAYSFRNDEWVEIVNPGPGTLALDGYILTDELGNPVYGFAGSLNAGAVNVIYGSASVQWESVHGEAQTGLRLGNEGDTVLLKQVIGSDTLMVDAYTYNTYEAEDDRSSGRRPDGGAAWELFDGLNPYTGSTPPAGNGLLPSPGARNDGGGDPPPPTPVREESWGRIKAIYTAE